MNENTIQFLNALSIKLGTTSEYLWNVLVRQAPIDGCITLIVMAAWLVVGAVVIRFFYTKNKDNDDHLDEGLTHFLLGISIVIYMCVMFIIGMCLSDAISSIVNPDYWAFNKILSSIKCK